MDELNSNEQLHLLRQAVLLSQANVVLADSDLLQVLDCSPAAHERLGNSREENLALAPLGLQGEPEHDAAWLKRQVALLHRQGQHSVQTRDRSSDGACADLMVSFSWRPAEAGSWRWSPIMRAVTGERSRDRPSASTNCCWMRNSSPSWATGNWITAAACHQPFSR